MDFAVSKLKINKINKESVKYFSSLVSGPIDLYRYILGPLDPQVCFIHIALKNAAKSQVLLYACGIIIFQHLSMTILKNPTGIIDRFWSILITVWISLITVMFHFVFFYLSGHPGEKFTI